jgi:SAM-dependent methyltransferase
MCDDNRWVRSWSDANAGLVHNARQVGEEALRRYWDRRAEYYGGITRADRLLRQAVVDYLVRDGILRPGDRVLDVGCGTGQYTLPMARVADSITGLDISTGMLDRMTRSAARHDLTNIQPIRSAWEPFAGDEKYDLVFSAFCPGTNRPEGLFKMERFSARSCCFLTGGGLGQPAFIYELMEILAGERYAAVDTDDFFAFNALYEAGRRPSVRSFSHRITPEESGDHAIQNAILYFDMLLGPDEKRKETISEYFDARSDDGEEGEPERSLYVVHWHPGQ